MAKNKNVRNLILALFSTLFLFNTAWANGDVKKDAKLIADELVGCGGVYSAMSTLLVDMDKERAATTMQDTSRGAVYAAAYIMFKASVYDDFNKSLEWSTNKSEARKNYWLGLLELHNSTEENPFPPEYQIALDYCIGIKEVQIELVEELRKEIYSTKE